MKDNVNRCFNCMQTLNNGLEICPNCGYVNVLKPCEIKPRLLYWRKAAKLEKKTIALIISDQKWNIKSIHCDESKFTVKDIKENDKHTIEVIPVSTKKALRDVIKIELKDDKGDSKIFTIHALIK